MRPETLLPARPFARGARKWRGWAPDTAMRATEAPTSDALLIVGAGVAGLSGYRTGPRGYPRYRD